MNSKLKARSLLAVLLVSMLALTVVWLSCEKEPQPVTAPETQGEVILAKTGNTDINKVMEVQDRHTADLMGVNGVIGTATAAHPDGGYAVAVLTKVDGVEKGVPKFLENVPVLVKNVGEITIQQCTAQFRPVPNGVSIGPITICLAGTAGCVVERVTPSGLKRAILSNNHVLANGNQLPKGTSIVQPARLDNIPTCAMDPSDIVGELGPFQTLIFGNINPAPNTMDAALAILNPGVAVTCATPVGFYGAPGATPVAPSIGMAVTKVGRTTCQNTGGITMINATVLVSGYPGGQVANFRNQIVTTAMSAGGDSGSLLVRSSDNAPVGLLFAGSATTTIHNEIIRVLNRFEVSICTAP